MFNDDSNFCLIFSSNDRAYILSFFFVILVILGEATTLSTFILKNNQRLTKANYVHLSRMTSMIIEYEIEFESNNEKWKNESNEQWLQTVDPLLKNLILLRSRLNQERINGSLDASYLKPFCDVIVNKDVSGPVTGLALQSIQKFLNFGFIKDGEIVKLIAESVTKARFVGTDSNSDEAVLMTILAILESLIVMPFYSLTNGLICEIMQSCFRIAFESRLSELLRKCAVKSLTEMVRALFTRISLFQEKGHHSGADGSLGNGGSDSDVSDFNYFYHDKNNASFHKLNRMGKRFVSAAGQNKHVNKTKLEVAKQSAKEDLTTLGKFLLFIPVYSFLIHNLFSIFVVCISKNRITYSKILWISMCSRTTVIFNIID